MWKSPAQKNARFMLYCGLFGAQFLWQYKPLTSRPSNYYDDMFENIRIQANTDAPDEFIETGSTYFANDVLQVLAFYSQRLPHNFARGMLPIAILLDSKANVEERFSGKDGQYTTHPPPPTIHILGGAFEPFERAVFWHEYAHHLWQCLGISSRDEWKALLAAIRTTVSYKEAQIYDSLFVHFGYMASAQELWARACCQFFLEQTRDDEALQELHHKYDPFQWNEREFSSLRFDIAETLTSVGIRLG